MKVPALVGDERLGPVEQLLKPLLLVEGIHERNGRDRILRLDHPPARALVESEFRLERVWSQDTR